MSAHRLQSYPPTLRHGTNCARATVDGVDGDADIARIGALVADPGRARILMALGDGRALPASVLADEAGVAASTASAHLAKLVAAGCCASSATDVIAISASPVGRSPS